MPASTSARPVTADTDPRALRRLHWRQHVGLAIVAAGALIQLAAIGHHLAAS